MTEQEHLTESRSSTDLQWVNLFDEIIANIEPQIWVRDANIDNFANGGQPLNVEVHIVDSAWITGTEYGPQIQHRYELEFYERRSVRARIAVTLGLLFDLNDDKSHDLESEYNRLEMDTAGQIEMFHRSGLYKHSWPQLREFVEHMVEEFFWDPLELPESFSPSGTPISSAYLQGLPY